MNKIQEIYKNDNIIIDKRLVAHSEYLKKIPRYVADYLISLKVDQNNPEKGIQDINKILDDHYTNSFYKQFIKSKIQTNGNFTLVGPIKVTYDQRNNMYWCDIECVDSHVRIDSSIVEQYSGQILTSGLWGRVEIRFDDTFLLHGSHYPFIITSFEPMQITGVQLYKYTSKRNNFTTEEWIDLLINTIGFNPQMLSKKQKLLYLCRLIPFVESGVNLIELGPTETGKTYLYRNISSHSHVISGSNTTVATLFYNKTNHKIGLIGTKDIVVFDEISSSRLMMDQDVINMLKDVMNSGYFTRGDAEFSSDCSVCFIGNTLPVNKMGYKAQVNEVDLYSLPKEIAEDRALVDRITGILPGREYPKVRHNAYSESYGFMTDYFAEILHKLRNKNYNSLMNRHIDYKDLSERNKRSISKICAGLVKLIFPDKQFTDDEFNMILSVAKSMRQRVVTQLKTLAPEEFKDICVEKVCIKGEVIV